jgi:hypothetical protein
MMYDHVRHDAIKSLKHVPRAYRAEFASLVLMDLYKRGRAVKLQNDRICSHGSICDIDLAVDLDLYVVAVRQALRAAELAAEFGVPGASDAVATCNQAAPMSKEARDVIEHFDDYKLGIGRLQGAGKRAPKWHYNPFIGRGAPGEVTLNLGGQLSVEIGPTSRAIQSLIDEITEANGKPPHL